MEQTSQTQAPGEARELVHGFFAHDNLPRKITNICTLRDGLQACLDCHWQEKDTRSRYITVGRHLYLGFWLSGKGAGSFWYAPNVKFSPKFSKRTLYRYLLVGMNRDFVDNRLGGAAHPGTKNLFVALEQGATGYHDTPFTLTPWMRSLIHQVEHNPYQGRLAELYAEARILDLIVLCMEAVGGMEKLAGDIRLSSQDVERVRHAADILVHHMEDPPTLVVLAKKVGLNENKLKQGFRQVFDTTAFGFLRQQRMLQARDMLSGGNVTVCQAACSVGYANPSHFSRAFFAAFGVKPGAYLGEAKDRATAVLRR